MLKLSLKQGQYLNIGDNIRVVYLGGSGSHGRFMIDAPRDVSIVRAVLNRTLSATRTPTILRARFPRRHRSR